LFQFYRDKMMHFGCCSAEVSSVLIQICCKDHQLDQFRSHSTASLQSDQ